MKMAGRMRPLRHMGVLAGALVLALGAFTGTARAEANDIMGMDFYYGTGESADTVGILSVEGSLGQTVFMEVKRGDQVIASHLAFTLSDENATAEGTDYVGVVSATIADFQPNQDYTVSVYGDREQTDLWYEGTISPVYASIEGAEPRIIALRTLAEGENRSFKVPSSVSFDNASYTLANKEPVSTEPLTYAYELSEADAIDGSVSYVDDEGNVLKSEVIAGIAQGTSKTVSIPAVITVGEGASATYWRTVNFNGSVTAAYPGTCDFTIPCKPLSREDGSNVGNFYFASISLVDEDGNLLASDSLNVTGKYLYTPPTRIHLAKDGLVETYVLAGDQDTLNSSGVLELEPGTEGVKEGSRTIDVVYQKLPNTAEATWTVVLVNGAEDPKSNTREIGRETFTVKPGKTASFRPEPELSIGGKTFVPVASTKDEYTFTYGSGDAPQRTVYYVPDGYVAPEPYEITVRYVNIATNEVLQSKILTSRPELRDELEISSPETFTQGGVEYVRLAGQEKSLWHSFYSSARTYTIYYRDVNDDLSANITITRISVVYDDVVTTTNNGGTTTDGTNNAEGGETNATGDVNANADADAQANQDATRAAIPDVDGLMVVNGDDNALVVDGDGRDTNTMRIEDDETPLAGPANVSDKADEQSITAGIGAALAVGAGLPLFMVFKRRKNNKADDADQA